MFQETKQKVMAGVLTTLILGMGGYWLAFADGNKGGEAMAEGVTSGPRIREVVAVASKGRDKARENVSDAGDRQPPAERPTVEERNEESKPKRRTESGRKDSKRRPPDGC